MGQISKFFSENIRFFSNPQGSSEQQEKFNFYGGLVALSEAVEDIESRLARIEASINSLKTK